MKYLIILILVSLHGFAMEEKSTSEFFRFKEGQSGTFLKSNYLVRCKLAVFENIREKEEKQKKEQEEKEGKEEKTYFKNYPGLPSKTVIIHQPRKKNLSIIKRLKQKSIEENNTANKLDKTDD